MFIIIPDFVRWPLLEQVLIKENKSIDEVKEIMAVVLTSKKEIMGSVGEISTNSGKKLSKSDFYVQRRKVCGYSINLLLD